MVFNGMLIGEAWGYHEARYHKPFIGPSGILLLTMLKDAEVCDFDRDLLRMYYKTRNNNYIAEAWDQAGVYRTNVFNEHPPDDQIGFFCGSSLEGIKGYPALVKSQYVRKEFQHHLDRLADEIESQSPNVIICLGNTPLWALGGVGGISKIRGTTRESTHTITGYKLLPTYHPAAVARQYELRPIVVADLIKARREAEFPEIRRPKREIWIEPTLDDLEEFYDLHIRGCKVLAVDIETSGVSVTCIGFCPNPGVALVVPFHDRRRKGGSYWNSTEDECAAVDFVRRIMEDRGIPKVFQNGLYDIAFLWRSLRIKTLGARHDTMLLAHAQQPEMLKGLGFLGSLYSDEGAWKTERKTSTIKRDE